MNKLLATVAAVAVLSASAAFAGPDTGMTPLLLKPLLPAAEEAAPAKADAAPVAKKHHGKKHAGKKHTGGHKKAKKDAAAK